MDKNLKILNNGEAVIGIRYNEVSSVIFIYFVLNIRNSAFTEEYKLCLYREVLNASE